MSKAKAQGTRQESAVVKVLQAAGFTARRIAEGGSKDEGDVEATLHGVEVIIEAKARQVLSAQGALSKARSKGGGKPALVWWKRLVPVTGKSVRQPVSGEREVIILSPTDLLTLLDAAYAAGKEAQ